jgi:hypothetical protein
MKLNPIPTLISALISGLMAYGMYAYASMEAKSLIAIGSFLMSIITLTIGIGVAYERPRTGINIRALALVFFLLGIISNTVFAFLGHLETAYILTNGSLLLVFLLITYQISTAKQ